MFNMFFNVDTSLLIVAGNVSFSFSSQMKKDKKLRKKIEKIEKI